MGFSKITLMGGPQKLVSSVRELPWSNSNLADYVELIF